MGKAIKLYPLVGLVVGAFILLIETVFLDVPVYSPLWQAIISFYPSLRLYQFSCTLIYLIFGTASVGFACWLVGESRGASVGGILVSLLIYYYLPILYSAVVYALCSLIIADRISESKYKDGLAILFFFLCLMIWGFSMWCAAEPSVVLGVVLIVWIVVFVLSMISYEPYFATGIFLLIYLFPLFTLPGILPEQVFKLYYFLFGLPPYLIGGYAIGLGIESAIAERTRKMLEKRRERKQRISYYKSKIKTWKEEGYSVELGELKDLDLAERKIREYESRIQKLKKIERELSSLKAEGFEEKVQSIRSKLRDPEKVEQAEIEFLELKRNIEEFERMKKEIIDMIDDAID